MRSIAPIVVAAALVLFGARAATLSGQDVDAGVRIDSVVVRGNVRQSVPTILSDFGIRPNDVVTQLDVQRGLQRLFATGQFEDVEILVRQTPQAVTLIVDVVERPFVTGYDFRGLEHVGAGGIRDTAGLESNAPLNPSAVFEAERRVRSELAKKGYVRARVDTAFRETGRPGEYRLVFNVNEGRRLVVADIQFRGNESVGRDELLGAMQVKPEGFFWWKTGEFREELFQEDLESNLARAYGARGYLDFGIVDDTMIVDPNTGKTKLVIEVQEGPQYRISDFTIEGNRHFPTEFLAQRFNPGQRSLLSRLPLIGGTEEQKDPVFNTVAWQDATQEVRQLYSNSGYIYAQVEPIVERLPDDAEDGSPRVRLAWSIQENDQAYFDLVAIAGNTTTHERVIRDRIVVLPGDVFSQERIGSSYQSIQGLGFFTPLPPQEAIQIDPNQQTGDIAVTFQVAERQTGNINFGASLSPASGVAGFLGYEQPNLFGQAKSGRFRWLFGSRTNDIELGYSDPNLLGTRNSMAISLRNSRDRFSFVGLGRRRQTGGTIRFGTPLLGSRWTRVSLGYSLFRDDFDSDEEDLELQQRELLNVGTRSSVDLRITRDTRNHPLFPSSGSRNSLSLEFTGGPFGGDGDYRKLVFESEWYTPIARLRSDPTKTPIDLVLGLSMEGGTIFGDNPFFLERFFMGGVQYGVPLRGYEELTITPRGHVPRETQGFSRLDRVGESFFKMNAQVGLQLGGSFYINAFYDAGNVWKSSFGLNPTDLLRGVGVGVSLVTPVGPLGIDYAYGIDRLDVLGRPDPGWKLHFRFGQIF